MQRIKNKIGKNLLCPLCIHVNDRHKCLKKRAPTLFPVKLTSQHSDQTRMQNKKISHLRTMRFSSSSNENKEKKTRAPGNHWFTQIARQSDLPRRGSTKLRIRQSHAGISVRLCTIGCRRIAKRQTLVGDVTMTERKKCDKKDFASARTLQ
jgi:hypothetical protein